VVLYANTPLLNKGHIKDLLGFVSRKHMNACKLKKGYVLKNDYIVGVDDLYSIDTYDFASNDFFEVKNHGDLSLVQEILEKKVLSYHKKNGVYFENESQVAIDATTEIGYASVVSAGARILNHSSIATNTKIGANAVVSNSKLGEDVVVGFGAVIEGCVVKNGAIIGDGVVLKNSVIGNNVVIGTGAVVVDSGAKDESQLADMVRLSNARLGENVRVGKMTQILGNVEPAVVLKNSLIGSNVQIVDSKIAESSEIEANKIVIDNKKVN
jgi:bifunctional N-acetylglucosamine-1-phosphate-uridyltransferase/glucosamine-1-phosphate-acetyltransferase GlmU-like protein